MLRATLRDENLEDEINENGFVLIRNFLNKEEVAQMNALYKRHHPNTPSQNGMWNSLYDISAADGREVSEELLKILRPKFDQIFSVYYTPVATFMTKNNNENCSCTLHRDFSNADETKFQYRNIWIPLVDTKPENGALYVLRGSNRVFNYPLPMLTEWPYRHMQEALFEKVETIQARAGDMVVYMDKTLHGSHVNHSDAARPVVHLGALHPDVDLMYFQLDKGAGMVKEYRVPFSFFFEKDFDREALKYPVAFSFKYEPPKLELSEVLEQLKSRETVKVQ